MKKILFSFFTKASLSLLLLGAAFTQSKAIGDADPNITMGMYPASVAVGGTAILEIDVDNYGQTTNIKTNSLQVQVSIGNNAEILGISTDPAYVSNTNWTVYAPLTTTGIGNTYFLYNTGGPVNVFAPDAQKIYLLVKGMVAGPTPVTFYGKVSYQAGGTNFAQGNTDNTNDNMPTSLMVTPNPLPVNLVSFSAAAVPAKCAAQLVWTTGEEKNFDHFTVQYSTDGSSFENAGNVKSNGNVMGSTYTYTMDQPTAKTYYRLQMVDKDGKTGTSKVAVVTTNCNTIGDNVAISVAPNPTHGMATVTGLTAGQRVLVFDMLGHQIGMYPVTGNALTVDMGNYAAGTYTLSVIDADSHLVQTLKLVKAN